MSMQAPASNVDLEIAQQHREDLRRRYTVGVVSPTGVVQEVVCDPDGTGIKSLDKGMEVVRLVEGQITITKYGRDAGWTLLEERCQQDNCPDVYERWLETVNARMDGHEIEMPLDKKLSTKDRPVYDMSSIYPPSVVEQRKNGPKGIAPKRFVPGKGLVDADGNPEKPEERKARVGRLLRQLGYEPEEAAE